MISLKGKNAIITGAGRGIGRATAIALAKEGVNLGLIGLNMSNQCIQIRGPRADRIAHARSKKTQYPCNSINTKYSSNGPSL